MVTAPASGETLVIVRNVPNTQETDYIENDPFPASSHEDALDKLTMEVQRLDEKFGRTPVIKETTTLSDIEFPEPGADEVVKWNAGGSALETKALADFTAIADPIPVANGGTGASDAVTARQNLAAGGGPAFFVHRNGVSQTGIATATLTKIQLTTEAFDTTGNFDSTTNYRFTPSEAGKYLFILQIEWSALGDTVEFRTVIRKNGADAVSKREFHSGPGSPVPGIAMVVLDMNGSTDYVEGWGYQASGLSRDVQGGSTVTFFCGMRIG
jgi:hypothetical protein